jgi:hypothetical protein
MKKREIAAGALESIDLQARVLFVGGDARVAVKHIREGYHNRWHGRVLLSPVLIWGFVTQRGPRRPPVLRRPSANKNVRYCYGTSPIQEPHTV